MTPEQFATEPGLACDGFGTALCPIVAVWCHIVLAMTFCEMEAPVQGNDYDQAHTHKDIYAGYTRFVKYSTGSVIVLVILMALFLL
ncbi:aa3-type cytochrome c oxidase subunit IV [Thalassospira mesophila]|uniref:Cytochrome c oxidase subunit IV bacterial aa3 type domain-containing protein n=1 Tax=Thalassospira mesophila TaxID=1293891 RepID=A0A1Y2KWL9_9PROT|nr:aa3-type cytochrome c oxidase subunit IV [Thalassospira mesophila]OSQ36589.1 hypothetical protein TMES_17615 [Thalassospira mesophila]